MPDHMPPEIEKRIRALPGNNLCCDCNNVNPQWASVSYGALVCLECSGQHRSLGVHLSFVRSIQMDSWSERQLQAMEISGGNASLVDYLKSRGIEKTMNIATKYNTKQAAYYRERLTRRLDGKTEPPPDPGRYDPTTGGSEAQGAEPLPGETTDQYNARQARLREEARERLRQKFGGSAGGAMMGGVGSEANVASGGFGSEEGLGGVLGGAVGLVGGVAGGAFGFFKEKVLENDNLKSTLRSSVSGLGNFATETFSGVRQTVSDGEVLAALKRNATFEEGSAARNVAGWTSHTATDVWTKSSAGFSDFFADGPGGTESAAPQAPRCKAGHSLRTEPQSSAKCSVCKAPGTRYSCSQGCDYDICTKCFEKPTTTAGKKDSSFNFDDDDWGQDAAPPPKDITSDDMNRLAKEMGMKLTADEAPAAAAAAAAAAASPGTASSPAQEPSPQRHSSTNSVGHSSSQSPSPSKPEKKGLASADDFFSEFGF